MKRILTALVLSVALGVTGVGAIALMTPAAEAVGCPAASGPITNIFCGGIAAIPCPGNLVCVDDPRDNCCPELGGADCSGVCAPRRR